MRQRALEAGGKRGHECPAGRTTAAVCRRELGGNHRARLPRCHRRPVEGAAEALVRAPSGVLEPIDDVLHRPEGHGRSPVVTTSPPEDLPNITTHQEVTFQDLGNIENGTL